MAFSRKRKRGSEQGKGLGKMGSEPASSVGCILEICLADESQNEIIEGGHDFAHLTRGHASGIFVQREIATIM
jgi:hypothetical protein